MRLEAANGWAHSKSGEGLRVAVDIAARFFKNSIDSLDCIWKRVGFYLWKIRHADIGLVSLSDAL